MDREERVKIFNETVECVLKGKYTTKDGVEIEIPKENDGLSIDNVELYDSDISKNVKFDKIHFVRTDIEVVDMDCLYAAKQLVDDGYAPAVLNMASFIRPGGGVQKGSAAQEENLCRRTNLFESIFRFNERDAMKFGLPVEEKQYPLKLHHGAVYSPSITVFRGGEDVGYEFLDEPFAVDVITVAAIKNPDTKGGKLDDWTKSILKEKIRTIFNLGMYWENDALVLGALGCGAYGTPPDEMAKLFKEVLKEPNYKNKFAKIVFAILDDHNAYKEHNPRGNFAPFKETFEL